MKIKVWVDTNLVGSKIEDVIEIDDSDLEGMSDQEQSVLIEAIAREWMFQQIEWGWERDE